MSDVLYLRPVDPATTPDDVVAMASEAGSCFDLHRVDWVQSCLARNGARMLCWYRAADAESVRIALRQLGADLGGVHTMQVLHGDRPSTPPDAPAHHTAGGFVAEWRPNAPVPELAEAVCRSGSERHPVQVRQVFASPATGHVIGVFQAADQEALRQCLEAAGAPPDALWPCALITRSAAG